MRAAVVNGPGVSATDERPVRGRAFGHGKVILLGEHAVVYGQPALAAALSLGVRAEVRDGTGRLTAPEWKTGSNVGPTGPKAEAQPGAPAEATGATTTTEVPLDARAGDGSPMGQALQAILTRLEAPDVDVRLASDLPPRAGLGSSAAVAIAVSRAVAAARGRSPEAAQLAAADSEVVFHGTPSGIDLAAASSGEVGRFQRGSGWRAIPALQPMTLCVGLSGRSRDTRTQVDSVRRLRERTPAVDRVIATLGEVAEAGDAALRVGDIDELGRLFDVAHGLLAALRVSTAELDALVHAARAAGAVGAKLTGAGGGGAVIALAPGHERDVLERWRAAGFNGFLTQIGPAVSGLTAAADQGSSRAKAVP